MENTRPPQDADSLYSIRVEGLSNDITKDELNKMFESYGKIGDIYIPRNTREGGNRGFGFVRFFSQDDAQAALRENGQTLHGEAIRVNLAESRPPRKERRERSRSNDRSRRNRSRSYGRKRSYSRSRSYGHRRTHKRSYDHDHDRDHHSSSRHERSNRRNPSASRSRSRSNSRQRSHSRG